MQHADRVSAAELNGVPALLLLPLLSRLAALGEGGGRLVMLPLFIAPSRALLVDIPAAVAAAAGASDASCLETGSASQRAAGYVPPPPGTAHGGPAQRIAGRSLVLAPALGGDADGVEALAAVLEKEVWRRPARRAQSRDPRTRRARRLAAAAAYARSGRAATVNVRTQEVRQGRSAARG